MGETSREVMRGEEGDQFEKSRMVGERCIRRKSRRVRGVHVCVCVVRLRWRGGGRSLVTQIR